MIWLLGGGGNYERSGVNCLAGIFTISIIYFGGCYRLVGDGSLIVWALRIELSLVSLILGKRIYFALSTLTKSWGNKVLL